MKHHNRPLLGLIALVLVSIVAAQQCTSNQFRVKNNDGDDYLVINSPTEVKTCGGINICDALNSGKQSLSLSNAGELTISSGNTVQLPDSSATNELQSLSLSGGQISLSSGNSIQLPDDSATNELQTLSLSGGQISLSSGNSVQLPDDSATNELQTLSLNSSGQLSLSSGNSVQLPDSSDTNELQTLTLSTTNLLTISNGNSVQLNTPVVVRASSDNGQTFSIKSTFQTVNFNRVSIDTHGAFVAGVFTVPVAGLYLVQGFILLNVGTSTSYNINTVVMVDGTYTALCQGSGTTPANHGGVTTACSDVVSVARGQQITFGLLFDQPARACDLYTEGNVFYATKLSN